MYSLVKRFLIFALQTQKKIYLDCGLDCNLQKRTLLKDNKFVDKNFLTYSHKLLKFKEMFILPKRNSKHLWGLTGNLLKIGSCQDHLNR